MDFIFFLIIGAMLALGIGGNVLFRVIRPRQTYRAMYKTDHALMAIASVMFLPLGLIHWSFAILTIFCIAVTLASLAYHHKNTYAHPSLPLGFMVFTGLGFLLTAIIFIAQLT